MMIALCVRETITEHAYVCDKYESCHNRTLNSLVSWPVLTLRVKKTNIFKCSITCLRCSKNRKQPKLAKAVDRSVQNSLQIYRYRVLEA